MVIALRLRLQQTEDLFIAGGVRFRLQLRYASLGGGEVQLHFDFNLAPRCGAKKGSVGIFWGGSDLNFGFSFEQPNSAGGVGFQMHFDFVWGQKPGARFGWDFFVHGGVVRFWLQLRLRNANLGRAHLHFDFDLLLKVWGLRAGWGFGCTSTSTLISPFLKSRCVWETTNQATSAHVDFGLDLEGCESKNIGLLVVCRLQYKTWEFWSFLLNQRKTWRILNGPPQNVGASVALHRGHCETWDFPLTLCWSQHSKCFSRHCGFSVALQLQSFCAETLGHLCWNHCKTWVTWLVLH